MVYILNILDLCLHIFKSQRNGWQTIHWMVILFLLFHGCWGPNVTLRIWRSECCWRLKLSWFESTCNRKDHRRFFRWDLFRRLSHYLVKRFRERAKENKREMKVFEGYNERTLYFYFSSIYSWQVSYLN